MMMKYDVIVAGAGPSGICSAIAAARQGARVALIERYGVIGGNLTAGYVGPVLGSVGKGTMRDEVCELPEFSIMTGSANRAMHITLKKQSSLLQNW
jgi:ribulose 1,5-bisphosphate synthetase/thiazole synthase